MKTQIVMLFMSPYVKEERIKMSNLEERIGILLVIKKNRLYSNAKYSLDHKRRSHNMRNSWGQIIILILFAMPCF